MKLLRSTKNLVSRAVDAIENPIPYAAPSVRFDNIVSTGSTLLDLAISGKRVRGGGIPAGIVCEFFGPPGCGKTGVLNSIAAAAQKKGGDVHYDDPEKRLDLGYAHMIGAEVTEENYHFPDTVSEVFKGIWGWNPKPSQKGAICVRIEDSLAALSTELEMEGEDKMGMRRAKEFSEGLRKTCRIIGKNNWIIACSNQIRSGERGKTTTTGGFGIPFYASLRVKMLPSYPEFKLKRVVDGTEVVEGVRITCEIFKTSISSTLFHKEEIFYLFDYGIHDVWANLEYLKDKNKNSLYLAFDKEFKAIRKAVQYIEDNNLEHELRKMVINRWEEINIKSRIIFKPKVWF